MGCHLTLGKSRIALAFRNRIERIVTHSVPIPIGTLANIVVAADVEHAMGIRLVTTVTGILVHRLEFTRL